MAMARPYPALEGLVVQYSDELQIHPSSSVPQLVSVTDDRTAERRRQQERTLLFAYAQMPNPDQYPEGGPAGAYSGTDQEVGVMSGVEEVGSNLDVRVEDSMDRSVPVVAGDPEVSGTTYR
eukprot:4568604-Amphidinium_carterae.3